MFCAKCGKEINDEAVICVHCGCAVQQNASTSEEKSWLVTLLLVFFLGGFGIHRFYTGYIGIGIIQLLTLGGCGIWALIDFICILCGAYKDANGCDLKK